MKPELVLLLVGVFLMFLLPVFPEMLVGILSVIRWVVRKLKGQRTPGITFSADEYLRKDEPTYSYPQCNHCGYDLTGTTSGRCPECGERF